MTADEYWNHDPYLAKAYIKAFKARQEAKWYDQWFAGQYFLAAIAAAFDKNTSYPEEPFQVTAKREADEERRKAARREAGRRWMEAFAASFNAAKKAKEEETLSDKDN